MPAFTPCDLPMGAEGNAGEFFAKVAGFGYNDMISLPTLTKDSILDNLKRRFKARRATRSGTGPAAHLPWAARTPGRLAPCA